MKTFKMWWIIMALIALFTLAMSFPVGADQAGRMAATGSIHMPLLLKPPEPTPTPTNTPTPTWTFTATSTPTFTPTPTWTWTPSPTPTPTPIQGWRGEYYDNLTLSGLPVLVRGDPEISFVWGASSPGPGVPSDGFSGRWTREVIFAAGEYIFNTRTDDGVRLWVDDNLLIDQWQDQGPTHLQGSIYLNSGPHKIQMEYYDRAGYAMAQLWWDTAPGSARWKAEYYANVGLLGDPVLVRYEPEVDHDWGTGSPDPAVPNDYFSARYSRSMFFVRGIYRFHVKSDDGVRLWINGELVIDKWSGQNWAEHMVEMPLETGLHFIRVEYYEEVGGARVKFWWGRADYFPHWKGEYWSNPTLSGAPVVTRDDLELNFNWGLGSPAAGVPSDNFSARWTRNLIFAAGTYRFYTNTSDGVRLWVNDVLLIDQWRDMDPTMHQATIYLPEGQHGIQMEYYDRHGTAVAMLWWEQEIGFSDWRGEYYNNTNLEGPPLFVRNDKAINFDWKDGSPVPGLNRDSFSVRWTREYNFAYTGEYTFVATTDDGMRVWLDDQLILDKWFGQPATTYYVTRWVTQGVRRLRVEYYEAGGLAMARFRWQAGPPTSDIIVDAGDPGFLRGGNPARWQTATTGYNGHLYWVPNTQGIADNWATWTPELSRPGFYQVYVYVPAGPGNARGVRYYTYYDGSRWMSTRVDQSLYFDQWVSLGIWRFQADNSEFIYLTDLTNQPAGMEQVAFDAIRFVYRGP